VFFQYYDKFSRKGFFAQRFKIDLNFQVSLTRPLYFTFPLLKNLSRQDTDDIPIFFKFKNHFALLPPNLLLQITIHQRPELAFLSCTKATLSCRIVSPGLLLGQGLKNFYLQPLLIVGQWKDGKFI